MTGKQLKNSILQWAIQGKLVPQDPNDEPASVLLEKIRQEKERLIKEKKIQRDKNASVIYRGEDNSYYEKFLATGEVKCIDEEIPFEIPQGWEWCRLGDVIQLLSGRDLEPYHYNSDGIGIPYMTGASIFCHEELIVNRWTEVPVTVSHIGDLLITCKGTIGTMAFNNIGDIHIARQIMGISSSYVSLKYIKLCLEIHIAELQKAARSIIPGISRDDMLYAIIPLPPIKEQERISDSLSDVLPFVDKYGNLRCKLDRLNTLINELLRKSILQEAIQGKLVPQIEAEGTAQELLELIKQEKQHLLKEGKLKKSALTDSVIFRGDDNKYYENHGKNVVCIDTEIPFEIPSSWQWVRLANVVQVNPKNDAPNETRAAFIPMECVDATYLSKYTYHERKWGDIKAGFTHFADGDVAFAKITPCFQNRKSMILRKLPNGIGAGTTELKVLRPYGKTINREYLLFFLESPYFVEEAVFKGTANQQRIISGYMENKLFPLPPLSEQQRISEKIKEAYKLIGM